MGMEDGGANGVGGDGGSGGGKGLRNKRGSEFHICALSCPTPLLSWCNVFSATATTTTTAATVITAIRVLLVVIVPAIPMLTSFRTAVPFWGQTT